MTLTRRHLLAALPLIALPATALAGERDGPAPTSLPFQVQRADGGWVTPDRLVIRGHGYAVSGQVPVTNHDRVDFGRVPILGDITGDVLGAEDFSPVNRVGALRIAERAIVFELDSTTPGLDGLPVSILTDLPRHGLTEFHLRPGAARAAPGPGAGSVEGAVYVIEGRRGRRLVGVVGDLPGYLIEW